MLAEKAKQQEEMLVEYDESEANKKDLESEVDLLRAQVDSMKDELKVSFCLFLYFLVIVFVLSLEANKRWCSNLFKIKLVSNRFW